MKYKISKLQKKDWPPLLSEIPTPPEKLFFAGEVPDYDRKFLCIVGARKYSQYGLDVVNTFVAGLRGLPVTIVSGLALGIDSIAHRAALRNKLPTIAIPGSGLSPFALHPATHVSLAEEIAASGGALLSEYESDFKATHYSFPQRNRIMAGMSHATLIIEAEQKSGTLITAKYATDFNRELMCVPGSIFAPQSEGPHLFLRLGATLVRNADDILDVLQVGKLSFPTIQNSRLKIQDLSSDKRQDNSLRYSDCGPNEIHIIELLSTPLERDELLRLSELSVADTQTTLTLLELKGHIYEKLGQIHLR